MKELLPTKQAAHMVTQKLASYFKLNKADLTGDVKMNGDAGVIRSRLLDEERRFTHFITCVQEPKIVLSTLLEYSKFVKTKVYNAFLHYEQDLAPTDRPFFALAVYVKGAVWIVTRGNYGYEGSGGIYVKGEGEGYCIEPIKTFLTDNYPEPD